ncbi:MAG TPA: hypothetical protein VF116_17000 [Ktedonobacterales bacterium]
MHAYRAYHHIADDSHRSLLVRHAVLKGIEQARGDFFFALLADGLDDEGVALCAREAWNVYHRQVTFDYPQFAETLYLHAYRAAYRRHLEDVTSGRHTDVLALARTIEIALVLLEAHCSDEDSGQHEV